jgi:hypothetical protein
MVTRDKDDPRNKEEGERGPGGVRIVIPADLFDFAAVARMRAPGSPMFEELSKMKVGRAEEVKGGSSGTLGHHSS